VPENLRAKKLEVIPAKINIVLPTRPPTSLDTSKAAAPQRRRTKSLISALVVLASAFGLFVALFPKGQEYIVTKIQSQRHVLTKLIRGPGPGRLTLSFGSEGIGPGLFQDARHIAVDEQGTIYVGEYSGGRIQVFDPSGKFLQMWMVDRNMPLRGLAVNRHGIVYVVQSGKIKRYKGSTGNYLSQIKYARGGGFDDVQSTADGGIVAAYYQNRDDIVRFDSQGKVTLRLRSAISGISGSSELSTRVASDGLGNIFALGTFNKAVFKFSSDGKYINWFGGAGDQAGQLRAPSAIAVDGQGRVYVSDFKGVNVFDSDGRYLTLIAVEGGLAFGMTFNDQNELLVAARTKVHKFNVSGLGQ